MSDIADRVKKIVVEHLGVDEEKVTDSASFIDDLGADSLDTVELVMAFEEEFGGTDLAGFHDARGMGSFRWTCCGSQAGTMAGCDHHGTGCSCDYCGACRRRRCVDILMPPG